MGRNARRYLFQKWNRCFLIFVCGGRSRKVCSRREPLSSDCLIPQPMQGRLRGYEYYNNIAHVNEKGLYYPFRVKDKNSSGILSGLNLPDEDEYDVNISIQLTRKCTKEVLCILKFINAAIKKSFWTLQFWIKIHSIFRNSGY